MRRARIGNAESLAREFIWWGTQHHNEGYQSALRRLFFADGIHLPTVSADEAASLYTRLLISIQEFTAADDRPLFVIDLGPAHEHGQGLRLWATQTGASTRLRVIRHADVSSRIQERSPMEEIAGQFVDRHWYGTIARPGTMSAGERFRERYAAEALCFSCGSVKRTPLDCCEACDSPAWLHPQLSLSFSEYTFRKRHLRRFSDAAQRIARQTDDAGDRIYALHHYVDQCRGAWIGGGLGDSDRLMRAEAICNDAGLIPFDVTRNETFLWWSGATIACAAWALFGFPGAFGVLVSALLAVPAFFVVWGLFFVTRLKIRDIYLADALSNLAGYFHQERRYERYRNRLRSHRRCPYCGLKMHRTSPRKCRNCRRKLLSPWN